jgi:hypothetical protein
VSIPLDKQIACVAREIAMRKSWYPRQVEAGRMKQEACDHQIAAMEAVLETLKSLQPTDKREGENAGPSSEEAHE